jgi:hypothetical protein
MAEGTRITRFRAGSQEYSFPFLQAWHDNFGDVVPRTLRLPMVNGGFDELGNEPAPAEIGSVRVSFGLVAETLAEMTTLLDEVRGMARWGKGRLFMHPADPAAEERWCWARVNSLPVSHNYERHTDLHQRIQMTFQVSDPHWYTQGTYPWSWGDGTKWGEKPWGGAAIPVACSGTLTEFTVSRVGNVPVPVRVSIVTSASQTAEDVTIQRVVNGVVVDQMKYTGVLANSSTLELDAWSYRVLLNGANAFTAAFLMPLQASWFTLLPGANTVRVVLKNPTDACSVILRYYEAYV